MYGIKPDKEYRTTYGARPRIRIHNGILEQEYDVIKEFKEGYPRYLLSREWIAVPITTDED